MHTLGDSTIAQILIEPTCVNRSRINALSSGMFSEDDKSLAGPNLRFLAYQRACHKKKNNQKEEGQKVHFSTNGLASIENVRRQDGVR